MKVTVSAGNKKKSLKSKAKKAYSKIKTMPNRKHGRITGMGAMRAIFKNEW